MAQRVHIDLVGDIDGAVAEETVSFALDGHVYDIDLTAVHAAELRAELEVYVEHARTAGGRKRGRPPARPRAARVAVALAARTPASDDPSVIREWAALNGVQVSGRGRIAAAVKAQYQAAH